ncbi:MAG: hypothetical protein IJW21_01240 [Clostridia bacterium]|nr:hypothetical protein [Clostridia bacterium]
MKKILALILIFATLALPLASCGEEEPPESTFVNDRFIFQLDNYVLKRYDLVSRTVSVACPDPLCEHGEGCIMSKVGTATITDKYVFISRNWRPSISNMGYYVYDIEKNTIELMHETIGSEHMYVAGDYAYFSCREPVYDDTGLLIERVWYMYRYDLKEKKLEKLSAEPVSGIAHAVTFTENEIYWRFHGTGMEYYITDYNFENRREWSHEEYLEYCAALNTVVGYTLKSTYGASPEGAIGSGYRIELIDEAGNKELIAEYSNGLRWDNIENRTGFIYQTGDFIPNKEGVLEFKSGNKLVYISLVDRTKRYEIDLPENAWVKIVGFQGCRHYVGEYTSLEAYVTKYDENGEKYLHNGIFVLNTKTGENFFIWDESKKYNDKWEEI